MILKSTRQQVFTHVASQSVANSNCVFFISRRAAKHLFDIIDKSGRGKISLIDLIVVARDNSSEEGKLLHRLLGLPVEVRQEDGTKDFIVKLFAELDR